MNSSLFQSSCICNDRFRCTTMFIPVALNSKQLKRFFESISTNVPHGTLERSVVLRVCPCKGIPRVESAGGTAHPWFQSVPRGTLDRFAASPISLWVAETCLRGHLNHHWVPGTMS